MAGLQRSEVSFRRQGSSGLVWDDRFLSGELNKVNQKENNDRPEHEHHHKSSEIKELKVAVGGSSNTIRRSRSNGGYRTGKVSPAIEPPSPKLSTCGFCSAFGKAGRDKGQRRRKQPAKPRSG